MPYRDPRSAAARAVAARRSKKYFATESGRAARKRTYHPKYQQASRKRIKAMLHTLKSVPCADCGGSFDPVCMDFDHRPDEVKSFTIGAVGSSRSLEAIRAEIAKCDVVCSNCHRIRSYRKRDHRAACKRTTIANPSPQQALALEPKC